MARSGVTFRPIIPKKPATSGDFPRKFKRVINDIANDVQDELEQPVKSWKHRVKFSKYIRYGFPRTILVRVSTTDEVYAYQDQGTKAHDVKPKNKKALSWVGPGGRRFFSKGHRVSGVKARKWTQAAKRKQQKKIKQAVDSFFRQFAKEI